MSQALLWGLWFISYAGIHSEAKKSGACHADFFAEPGLREDTEERLERTKEESSSMKKVLFVINTLGGAGAEKALAGTFEKIYTADQYEIDLYVLLDQGELIQPGTGVCEDSEQRAIRQNLFYLAEGKK